MSGAKNVLVFDLGASSGRAMVLSLEDGKVSLTEVHRFPNDPVTVNGTLYWDILRLFHEIKQGIVKANAFTDEPILGIGIDTWGVDFGLIGEDGALIENPVCYRDRRTEEIPEEFFKKISPERLYEMTGVQIMDINTVFQLYSLNLKRPHILKSARKVLLMPDLFNYLLTGRIYAENSIASTTALMSGSEWSSEILSAVEVPTAYFPQIIPSGTKIGELSEDICSELQVSKCAVTAVCGHDTQCAAAAVPCVSDEEHIFISCGTWSLFGTETAAPVITEKSAALGVSNETGYGGKVTFLKNIIGLWFIQETRRFLAKKGQEYSFADLENMAKSAEPFKCFIDPDSPEFVPPGDIPGRVAEFCKRTGQYVPQNLAETMRCIYESLAMKYRQSLEEIEECKGKTYSRIYMVGGGIKDKFLCRLAASACGRQVTAGPVEAAAYGNGLIQLIALGEISDIIAARKILAASEKTDTFEQENPAEWDSAYKKYTAICGCQH
ncbi:MAG: rhamnulokinase [Oscillospiraceae bacterium]|nr:rhamnulokinase [Oscillospiraceae bacterium]